MRPLYGEITLWITEGSETNVNPPRINKLGVSEDQTSVFLRHGQQVDLNVVTKVQLCAATSQVKSRVPFLFSLTIARH